MTIGCASAVRPLAGQRIVVDPGHGGKDPGAIGKSGLQEKEVNLDVGLRLRERLEKLGAQVRMTRETDTSVAPPGADKRAELQARVDVANEWPCDFFISVHSNAAVRPDKRGTECYHALQASPHSRVLSALVQRQMVKQLELPGNGVIPADFYVLRHTDMPATLVETAYLSNPEEEALLADPAFRERIAVAVADGVRDYLDVSRSLEEHDIRHVPPSGPGEAEEYLVA